MRRDWTFVISAVVVTASGPAFAVPQASVRDGVFFEAEGFDTRHPQEPDFASLIGEAAASDGTVLYRKGDATIVHLVNDISSFGRSAAPNPEAFGGFRSEVIPIHDIRLGLPGTFRSIHLEPGGTPITGSSRDGLTWVTVPTLVEHTMVVAER